MRTRVHATVEGNLVGDPIFGEPANGTKFAKFTVAVTDRDLRDGRWVYGDTESHRTTAFGRTAESVRDTLAKGDGVMVTGGLEFRRWTDAASGEHRNTTDRRCHAGASLCASSELEHTTDYWRRNCGDGDELACAGTSHRPNSAVTLMTASPATFALITARCLRKQQPEKALPLLCQMLEPRLVISCDQQPLACCGLAPCVEELKRDLLGCGRWTQWVGPHDRAAKLVAGVRHDEVEHRIELRQVDGHGGGLHARGAADAGRRVRSRCNSRVTQQHLRSIRFNLVHLTHFDRMTDGGCLRAATTIGAPNQRFGRAVRDMSERRARTGSSA